VLAALQNIDLVAEHRILEHRLASGTGHVNGDGSDLTVGAARAPDAAAPHVGNFGHGGASSASVALAAMPTSVVLTAMSGLVVLPAMLVALAAVSATHLEQYWLALSPVYASVSTENPGDGGNSRHRATTS
jgi:hypothetical protein